MKINASFDKRVVVHSEKIDWLESPMKGVTRRPLDRVGKEVARATTIVNYEPGSSFSSHVHTGGEEYIVLDGVFQDEHGDYPVGSYVRNPPFSKHTPSSIPGCTIFVKLWQFDPSDRNTVRLNMNIMNAIPHKDLSGISVIPLYKDDYEEVSLLEFNPCSELKLDLYNGAEFLILDGELKENDDILVKNSWLRIPVNGKVDATAGINGAKVWVKQGHLNRVNAENDRVAKA
jgi:hypothetical protein